jgi:predicted branched-subunit amino acid permease
MTEPQPSRLPDEDPQVFAEGIKTGTPTLFGIGAWGLVVGVAMIKSHLTVAQALAMSFMVFAGSAQLASLPLIAANAPIWVVFATALVVNLRFVIFSALLAPHFSHLPWRKRLFLGYFAGDLTVAMFMRRFPTFDAAIGKVSFLKGLLYPNWSAWQIGSLIGIFVGSQVPTNWGLGFAGTLAIICVTVPLVVGRAAIAGVIVAGGVAIWGYALPYKLGLLAAVLVGMAVALLVEEWIPEPPAPPAQ